MKAMMEQERSKIKKAFSLVVLTIIVILLTACDLTMEERYTVQELDYAEEQGELIRIYDYNEEVLERVTVAERIDRYYDKKQTVSKQVVITDYNPDGSVQTLFSADVMTIDEIRDTYTATGNVIIDRIDTILYTEHLIWNQTTDEIFSPVEITLIRGENVIKGIELRTDSMFQNLELKMVTAEGKLDEEDIVW
jgi:LPS export ABC transporter protein LptC